MNHAGANLIHPCPSGEPRTRYEAFVASCRLSLESGEWVWTDSKGSARWRTDYDASDAIPVLSRVVRVETWRFTIPNFQVPETHLLILDSHDRVLRRLGKASTSVGADCTLEELDRIWPQSAFDELGELRIGYATEEARDVLAMAHRYAGSISTLSAVMGSRTAFRLAWGLVAFALLGIVVGYFL